MEINLFSKCVKDLIVENDRVEVPYLGIFSAEMMPASYSDRQTTIHPPYRKMSFHKAEVTLADGRLLLDRVRRELGVSLDQAGVELGWCLSRLCSELEGRKSCKLPGLGMMRANARNEFFFVPNDDLDIWPDGLGFEAISIKVSEKMPGQAGHDADEQAPSGVWGSAPVEQATSVVDAKPEQRNNKAVLPVPGLVYEHEIEKQEAPRPRRRLKPVWIVFIALGVLLTLFIAASYLFTDAMSPILDPLLYSKEELELLRGR
ncbi:MAG: hypothetical protein IJL93_05820 [Bacteroidales bacterium]|nr:hypothetical protein [Bacteroidales bacterium]